MRLMSIDFLMKKLFLSLLASMIAVASLARVYPKNLVSVEAGYNIAWATSCGVKASTIPAFVVGVTDHMLLTERMPFYLETGLMFQSKGYAVKGYEESKTMTYHLQVPVNVNYHIYINDLVRLEPGLGLYYSLGLGGKRSYAGTKQNVYKDGSLSRHDLGWSCGLNCSVSKFTFGVAYEMSFLNVDKNDMVYGAGSMKLGYRDIRPYLFSVRVGVNF